MELPVGSDGRRRRIRRGGFTTRKAAEEALAQVRAPSGSGGGLVTVGEWLTHWLATRSGAASTIGGYASHVRLYLAPYLGTVVLAELSVAHLQAVFASIARHHQARGAPLTPATLNRIRATLRTALNAAIRRGLISDNPASRVELPTARRPRAVVWTAERVRHWQRTGERPPVAVWTAAQTAEFLDTIRDHRLYAAYHLIALRGLRRGEAAGLRWCDVDLDQGVAVISQQIQQHQGQLTVCPPKTASSARVIALDRTTIRALRAHRDRQQAERQRAGEGYRDSGYVFTRPGGDPLGPDRLSCTFRALIAEHGLPPIRLHDLRHGAATLALAAGVELKVVQDMLGHSSIVLTADTYTSVLPEVAHRAAEKTAAHVMKARGIVPGTNRTRRRAPSRKKRRRGRKTATRPGASSAHPARQIGHPQRR
ncbi:tyrosine-type recombinase/integrase [Actinomadura decatromicini]|uniref:tyrosine-type recombinase/integrase n=1 Tax=Actinomadura decatromicini TaxID=2604572 RepID=UPI001652EA86|nr:tyrosine-type recombinase/integrase [Actinomadura decatromicini]